jgi:hypothetical protein
MPDPFPLPVSADPAALAQVAGALQVQAEEMRSGAPSLQGAWRQAASALTGQRTGDALGETRPGSAVVLEEFAASADALAQTLRRTAQSYEQTDEAAFPAGAEAGRP